MNKAKERLIKKIKKHTDNPRLITAFERVPREKFVPEKLHNRAYEDTALSIGKGQTISQPSLVAAMTDLLRLTGKEKVLEIGTGSGYQAAILGELAKEVHTVERITELAERAEKILKKLKYTNIRTYVANGTLGLPDIAPFDAIIVTAGAKKIPKELIGQLKEGGRIVIPVGSNIWSQDLKLGIKKNGKLETKTIEPVRFVPLIGKRGWHEALQTFFDI